MRFLMRARAICNINGRGSSIARAMHASLPYHSVQGLFPRVYGT